MKKTLTLLTLSFVALARAADCKFDFGPGDHSYCGSYELARCIGQAIKENKLPLAKYLIDTPPFDPVPAELNEN
jgi:hypothetical protein